MKFIINDNRLIDAHTNWTERMGALTPEEFADQIGGVVAVVPDTYDSKNISIECFTSNNEGVYTFSTQLYNEHINSKKMDYIRRKRNFECFRVVNRGQLWYNSLSQDERDELQEWYNAWLVLPNRPDLNINSPQYPTPPAFLTDFIPYEDVLPAEVFN